MIWIIALISLASAVSAESSPIFIVSVDSSESPTKFTGFAVLEFNDFPDNRLYEDHSEDSETHELVIESSSGDELQRLFLEGPSTMTSFRKDIFKVKVVSQSSTLFEKQISFCDSDNICEPCTGSDCSLIENVLTCGDCSSGSADNFCDTESDSICDPDCDGDFSDPDCGDDCGEEYCDDDDTSSVPECARYGGTICEYDEDCIHGLMIFSGDSMYCCLDGFCANTGEYVETTAEMEAQPSMTITPSGALASDVRSVGVGKYCLQELGGRFCSFDESCTGNNVEYYKDTFCCMGSCAKVPASAVEIINYEEAVELTEFATDEDDLGIAPDYDVLDEFPEETWQEFEEGDFPHESFAEVDEETPLISTEYVEQVVAAAEEKLDKISFLHVAIVLILVLVVVFLLVGLFKRKASEQISSEVDTSGTTAPVKQDLQSDIDSLVSQGNDYKKAEQALIERGYDKAVVDAEIRKNYQQRVALQRKKDA